MEADAIQWRLYSCEEGHSWEILTTEKTLESVSDRICQYGHDAVHASRRNPSGYVVVTVIPKARQLNASSSKIGYEHQYYVKIECLLDGWAQISNTAFPREKALEIASLFVGMEKHAASRVWLAKKLGNAGKRMNLN